jgi:hypothetical protein
MEKPQISDLLNELNSSEAYIRNDAIKKVIKGKIDDEQIILALKEVIENDRSMAVRNFARSALDVFGIEHSTVEEPIVETRSIEVHAEPLKANNEDQPIDPIRKVILVTLFAITGSIITPLLFVCFIANLTMGESLEIMSVIPSAIIGAILGGLIADRYYK